MTSMYSNIHVTTVYKERTEVIACTKLFSQNNKVWVIHQRMFFIFKENWKLHSNVGVNKVDDLQFINGKVNEAYLYEIIQWKTNIHSEILMVKKALEPYSHLILNYEHITNDIDPAIVRKKSREFYAKLVNIKCDTIESTDMCPNLHHMCTLSDISVECAFRNQLCSVEI